MVALRLTLAGFLISALAVNAGCGPGSDGDPTGSIDSEDPGNCSGANASDQDGDGYSVCSGDCNDNDEAVHPGALELPDGIDNDCNGQVDDHLATDDNDGDGYSAVDGDCNDSEPLVNPGAVEVGTIIDDSGNEVPEGVDNDCDGQVDEAPQPCDSGLSTSSATDYAKAMDLCSSVESASFTADMDSRARNILDHFGDVYVPHAGSTFAVLSTGIAVDASDSSFVDPNGGTPFSNTAPHPDPQGDPGDGCGAADPSTVNDYVELDFDIKVPSNAKSLAYDFNFVSGEFPEWVCTAYDDTFLAILESDSFTGNISFDDAGRPVTINIGFFDVCPTSSGSDCTGDDELQGTGYEDGVGGGTGWLTTTAPVTPGETIKLRFIIFDEGDHYFDSTVLLDNFRWIGTAVDNPITVERVPVTRRPHQLEGGSPWQMSGR